MSFRPAALLATISSDARVRRALILVGLSIPLILIATKSWQQRWTSDDGFIDYRIAANLAHGDGPVFNLGERVEAYTNPLWVGFVALVITLGAAPEVPAAVAGVVLVTLGLALSTRAAMSLTSVRPNERMATLLPCGALAFASIPVAWDYATAGLETGLALFWLGAAYASTVSVVLSKPGSSNSEGYRPFACALLLSAGPLIRPDLAIYALGYAVALLFYTRRFSLLAPLLFLPLEYQLFRMGYFACLLPTTAVAKSAGAANWGQGLKYLLDFALTYWIFPLLVAVALVAWRAVYRIDPTRRLLTLLPAALGVAHGLYIVRLGGDFMHGRMLLLPIFAILQSVAVVRFERSDLVIGLLGISVIGWSLVGVTRFEIANQELSQRFPTIFPDPQASRGRYKDDGIFDERKFYARRTSRENPVRLEDFVAFHLYQDGARVQWEARKCARTPGCAPFLLEDTDDKSDTFFSDGRATRVPLADWVDGRVRAVAARGQVGAFGYLVGPTVAVVNRFGLSDWVASRLPLTIRGRPGHEKFLPNAWIVARYGAELPNERPAVAAARRALRCGRLGELDEAIRAPLTMPRFMHNFAVSLWSGSLVVPDDPAVAERTFCN